MSYPKECILFYDNNIYRTFHFLNGWCATEDGIETFNQMIAKLIVEKKFNIDSIQIKSYNDSSIDLKEFKLVIKKLEDIRNKEMVWKDFLKSKYPIYKNGDYFLQSYHDSMYRIVRYGVLDENMKFVFCNGGCYVFAKLLAKRTGWKRMAIAVKYYWNEGQLYMEKKNPNDEEYWREPHVFVLSPNGRCIDIEGVHERLNFIRNYSSFDEGTKFQDAELREFKDFEEEEISELDKSLVILFNSIIEEYKNTYLQNLEMI
jgi:hypothetical protein